MLQSYSLAQIGEFLHTERLATHGVSPDVYAQNRELFQVMRTTARQLSPDLLGIQFIGSRVNGTASLESDVDQIVIAYDTECGRADQKTLVTAIEETGIEADNGFAAAASAIKTLIPVTATDFIEWVESDPASTKGLFEDGIHTAPDIFMARVAVTSILKTYRFSPIAPQQEWRRIYTSHACTYAGDITKMRLNLAERVAPTDTAAVNSVITKDLITHRRHMVALPAALADYDTYLNNVIEQQNIKIKDTRGYALYQDVLKQLQ